MEEPGVRPCVVIVASRHDDIIPSVCYPLSLLPGLQAALFHVSSLPPSLGSRWSLRPQVRGGFGCCRSARGFVAEGKEWEALLCRRLRRGERAACRP
eukprot:454730-Rhodomonas_salina.1